MPISLYKTNIAILKEALTGKSYQECAKQFNITVANVSQYICSFLDALREHTDIDIISSASYAYIHEKKKKLNNILMHLCLKFLLPRLLKHICNKILGNIMQKIRLK